MDNLSHVCIYIDLCINNLHRDDIEGLHVDMASINPNNVSNDDEDDGTNNLHNESSSDDGGFFESVDDISEDV